MSGRREHRRITLAGAALATGLLLASCSSDVDTVASTGETSPTTTTAPEDAPEFGYEGDIGPDHWGELSEDWADCADGTMQSPIDLTDPEPGDLDPVELDYVAGDAEVHDTGHSIQIDVPQGSALVLEGTRYDLVQAHFHAPSEHLIAGDVAAAELHFVHRSTAGALAVLAVLVEQGAAAEAWDPVLEAVADTGPPGTDPVELAELDPAALVPEGRISIRYEGSLTTPPCTEGVHWTILTDPLELSAAQIGVLTDRHEGNVRPAQPVGDRDVLTDDSDGDGTDT